ncbi:hypothetical protein EJO69_08205 [Flaviflexus salsibiostraticola]|uniref:Murein biosynthesis integral membrane protein MurJ n=1 Tax=Flaviflexus salsibiostraticola TaxID=1282737 RepID=A0A3S8Z9X4_9ACTO|nr:lipid II flippase MurJ [Flaviflexus salsibiostraticola]AZN30291.1 hypothetical protein EJO69_08205 [Flaviflexus salsibiostraticola]
MAGGIARSSAVMFAGTLVSRLLGLVRSPLLFGIAVGLNYPAGNAFDIANKLPTLIYMLVAGGVVNAVLVPAIVRASSRHDDGGAAYINKMVTLGVLVLGAITTVLTLASPLLVTLFASGLQGEWYQLAVAFAYWCVPQVFFYGMYTLLGQILNARENFGPFMWAPVLNNIVAIGGMLALLSIDGPTTPENALDASLWDGSRIAILGGSATLGIIVQAAILLIPLYRMGVRLKPDFAFRGAGLRSVAQSGGWVLASMGAGMIPTLLISNVASVASQRASTMSPLDALGVPGNAAYTTAYSLYSLPTSLVVVSIVTAIFTRMAQKATSGNLAGVRDDTSRALRIVAVFTFLATALIAVLATPAIRIISPGSAWEEVSSIGPVLLTMSLGLVGVGSFTVLQRVYYALEDAKGLFVIQIPFFILHSVLILSTILLPARFIVVGVGLSMAITNTATFVAALLQLRRRLGGIDGHTILASFTRLGAAALVATAAGFMVLRLFGPLTAEFTFSQAVARILVITPVVTAIYLGIMWLGRMPELQVLMRPLMGVLRRLQRRPSPQATTLDGIERSSTDGVNVSLNLLPGRRLRDRYELVDHLESTDGMEIWQGVDTVLGADVRLMILPTDQPTREATVDAARRGVLVDDVRLIKLLSIFDMPGASVIVSELPTGTTMAEYIASGPVPEDQARAIVGETAGALDAGTRRGVRHLTLREELVRLDPEGSVFVDGLGVDAAFAGEHAADVDPDALDRRDAENLAVLLAALVLGEESPEADRTEFLQRAAEESSDETISTLLADVSRGEGPQSTSGIIKALAPWGSIDAASMPDLQPTQAMTAVTDPFAEPVQPAKATVASPIAAPVIRPAPTVWPQRTPESPSDPSSWTALSAEPEDNNRSDNSSNILLGIIAVLVLLIGVFAFRYLTSDTSPVTIADDETTAAAEETTGEEPTPAEEPTTEEVIEYPDPQIQSISLLNPQAAQLDPTTVDSQDNPGSIPNLSDGNPGTSWSSWWYSDQGFWLKDGIGLEITLAEETEITDVVLAVDGNGGLVQWRDTVNAAPDSGQILAESAMSSETVLTAAEPVVSQTIILWFDELPTANSDGLFRIDISEITVR